MPEYLTYLAQVIGGLVLLVWGGDRFVYGASAVARNLGVTPLIIGLTIVSFATSAPEFLVSTVAAVRGASGLAIGNAIGSNIANIGLVLGAVALIHPIKLQTTNAQREMGILIVITFMTVFLFSDSLLSRLDGIVLLTGLIIFGVWVVRRGVALNDPVTLRSRPHNPKEINNDTDIDNHIKMIVAIFWVVIGLVMLLAGAELLLKGAVSIAREFSVSEIIIGITLVALATSLPELAVSVVGAFRGEYGLVLGNIVGSNIFNLLGVVGVAAVIPENPIELPPNVLSLHLVVMVALTLALFAMTYKSKDIYIGRFKGIILMAAYLSFNAYLVTQNVRID